MQTPDVRRFYKQALDKHGYKTVEDVTSTLPKDLAVGESGMETAADPAELGVGLSQADKILRVVSQQSSEFCIPALSDPSPHGVPPNTCQVSYGISTP